MQAKTQVFESDHVTFCCRVESIDTEDLINLTVSEQPLPRSNIAIYFVSDIDHVLETGKSLCSFDTVVTNEHVPQYLVNYLKTAYARDSLMPYLVYEIFGEHGATKPESVHLVKPVKHYSSAGEAKVQLLKMPSSFETAIASALNFIEVLHGLTEVEALEAMHHRIAQSQLNVIEVKMQD